MRKKILKRLLQTASAFFLITASTQLEAWDFVSHSCHTATDLHGSCLLTLEDGSEWKVADSDQSTLNEWYAEGSSVSVKITPNYYSSNTHYGYYLTSQHTGSYVRANLVTGPVRGSAQAVTITGIDRTSYDFGLMLLSNGTIWKVSSSDLDRMKNWYVDDLVIIGNNSEWFTYYDYVIIDIHTNNYVRALRLKFFL